MVVLLPIVLVVVVVVVVLLSKKSKAKESEPTVWPSPQSDRPEPSRFSDMKPGLAPSAPLEPIAERKAPSAEPPRALEAGPSNAPAVVPPSLPATAVSSSPAVPAVAASESATTSPPAPSVAASDDTSSVTPEDELIGHEADDEPDLSRFGVASTKPPSPPPVMPVAPAKVVRHLELPPEPAVESAAAHSEPVEADDSESVPTVMASLDDAETVGADFGDFDDDLDLDLDLEPAGAFDDPEPDFDPVVVIDAAEPEPAFEFEPVVVDEPPVAFDPSDLVVVEPEPVVVFEPVVADEPVVAFDASDLVVVEPEPVVEWVAAEIEAASQMQAAAEVGNLESSDANDNESDAVGVDEAPLEAPLERASAELDIGDVDLVIQALIHRAKDQNQSVVEVASELVEQANLDGREATEALADLVKADLVKADTDLVNVADRLSELTLFNEDVPRKPGALTQFMDLNDVARKRVIVRVLCLLVAKSENDMKSLPRTPASEAETRQWPLARAVWPLPAPAGDAEDPLLPNRDLDVKA